MASGRFPDRSVTVQLRVTEKAPVPANACRARFMRTPAAMRRRAVLLLVALMPALETELASAGESPVTPAMTLSEALQYAHAHHPALRAAVARLEAVRTDAAISRARWAPTFVATAQLLATTTNNTTGSYLAVPGFDNPRVSATRADSPSTASLAPSPSTLLGLGARQEVFDFGRISAQVAVDDLTADAERFSLESTRLVIDYDVEEAYFAVYAAQAIETASVHAYERAAVHRDLARAGVDSGLRRPIELTRSEATLDRYELGRIRARRGVAVAQTVFAAAVGFPDSRLDISGAAASPADLPPLPAALAAALSRNPELLAAGARERAQQARTQAIESEARPNLFLSGALSGNAGGGTPSSGDSAPDHGLLPFVPNWDVGLVLSWPLFDATVSARADKARLAESADREETNALRLHVSASVEHAYLDVEAASDALPVLRHTMDAAVANYAQASARFEIGLGDTVELADAEELRTDAEIQLALGTFEVAHARAALGRLMAERP
jgi:outer membrane protein